MSRSTNKQHLSPHRNADYLSFIRSRGCLTCASEDGIQAAHIRLENGGGVGLKPSDYRTVPLCPVCHQRQHQEGEVVFWRTRGADPDALVIQLLAAYLTDRYARWDVFAGSRVERRKEIVAALEQLLEELR